MYWPYPDYFCAEYSVRYSPKSDYFVLCVLWALEPTVPTSVLTYTLLFTTTRRILGFESRLSANFLSKKTTYTFLVESALREWVNKLRWKSTSEGKAEPNARQKTKGTYRSRWEGEEPIIVSVTPDLRDLQRAGNVQVINGMMKKKKKKKKKL